VVAVWPATNALIIEVISHFTHLASHRKIELPCADIYRFENGRIVDWRVYADMSPLRLPD
jgi:limonene-1,2-epoxide hydrolase